MTDAREVAERLGMRPHPEGGWYVETWQPTGPDGTRGVASAILFLVGAGQVSHWHRLDCDEIWQWAAGDPLELRTWTEGDAEIAVQRLDGLAGGGAAAFQGLVPAGAWQTARSLGEWTLVGCVVAPAFTFDGFELAAPDWEPPLG
jgi:predicted cupin superfamily sugar epimerase